MAYESPLAKRNKQKKEPVKQESKKSDYKSPLAIRKQARPANPINPFTNTTPVNFNLQAPSIAASMPKPVKKPFIDVNSSAFDVKKSFDRDLDRSSNLLEAARVVPYRFGAGLESGVGGLINAGNTGIKAAQGISQKFRDLADTKIFGKEPMTDTQKTDYVNNNPYSRVLNPIVNKFDKESQLANQAGSSTNPTIQKAGDLSYMIGNMAPGIAASAGGAPPLLATGLLGASKGGNEALQAQKQDKTVNQQLAVGAATGLNEAITEYLPFSYGGKLVSGQLGKVVSGGIKTALSKLGSKGLKTWVANTMINVAQEVATSPLDQLARNKILGQNEKLFDINTAKQDATGALAISLVFTALGLPSQFRSHQMAQNIVNNGNAPTTEQTSGLQEQIKSDSGVDVASEVSKVADSTIVPPTQKEGLKVPLMDTQVVAKQTNVPIDNTVKNSYSQNNGGDVMSKDRNKKPVGFEQSKILDDKGDLLEVYHGTTGKFDTFDKKYIGNRDEGIYGKGFYFSNNKNTALFYTEEKGSILGKTDASKIISANLNLKNPLRIDFDGNIPVDIKESIKNIYNDKIEIYNETVEPTDNLFGSETKELITNEFDKLSIARILNIIDDSSIFQKALMDKGYDGVVVGNGKEYMVFEPEQIHIKKSTDSTNTQLTQEQPLNTPKTDAHTPTDADFNLDSMVDEQSITQALEKVAEIEKNNPELYLKMNLQLFSEKAKEKLDGIRKSASNSFKNAPVLQDSGFSDQVDLDDYGYKKVSNKEQWDSANKRLDEDVQGTLIDFMGLNKLGGKKGFDTATGEALLVKYSKEGDFKTANRVSIHLAEMMTDAGQTVQAMAILKRLTPEGMLYYANKTLNKVNMELPKGAEKVKLTEDESKLINDVMEEVNKKDYEAIKNRLKENGIKDADKLSDSELEVIGVQMALQTISNKVPSDFTSKQQSIRRISMLLNPKTQVRNIVGNTIVTSAENISQVVSANLDKLTSIFTGERKTLLPQITPQVKGFIKGFQDAIRDYKLGIDTSNSGGGAYEVQRSKQVFKNKTLNKVNNFLSFIMTLGDRPFYQAAYNERIAELEKIGNEITNDTKLQAHEYALDKVFQNSTEISKAASEIKRTLNRANIGGFGLGDAATPFTKTPANILRKGVQYTPLGIVSAVKSFNAEISVKGGLKVKTDFKQKEFTDSIARSLVGTSIMTVGYLLAKAGFATGDYDKSKDKETLQNLAGETNYSFKIGDSYYSFDWAQPISIPLSVGIDFYASAKSEDDLMKAIGNGLVSGGNSLIKQSMLQGITRMLGGYSPSQGIADTIKYAPLQYFPTILNQIGKTSDPYQRKTETLGDRAKAKIPGLRNTLSPKLDPFGSPLSNNQGRGTASKIAENFLYPGTVNKTSSDNITKELIRLTKTSSEKGFLPNVAPNSFTQDSVTVQLDLKQRNKFQEIMGKANYEGMKSKMLEPMYKLMTNEEKIKALEKINKKSYSKAKEHFIKGGK